jgi:hypothetical protein
MLYAFTVAVTATLLAGLIVWRARHRYNAARNSSGRRGASHDVPTRDATVWPLSPLLNDGGLSKRTLIRQKDGRRHWLHEL